MRLADLIDMRRTPYSRTMLYNEQTLAGVHRPLWFALRCSLPFGPELQTLVYRERGLRGYLQSRCRSFTPEADVLYFAMQPRRRGMSQPTDPDVWYRLLEECVTRGGARGIERFYAPLPLNSSMAEVFRQLGFHTYAKRHVWRMLAPDVQEGSAMIALRPQQRRDPLAIQRLYESVTPQAVQRAELRSARSWQLPVVGAPYGVRQRSWVLGRDGRDDVLRAALHLWLGSRAAVVQLLIEPEERNLASAILRFGLTQVAAAHQGSVYILVPEYHAELETPLYELGFEYLGEQQLFMKTTTVNIRKHLLRPALDAPLDQAVARMNVHGTSGIIAESVSYKRGASVC